MATDSGVYADVAIDVNVKNIASRLFTYKIPAALAGDVFIGTHVLVPFGHQEAVSGYVISLKNTCEAPDKTKDISEVLDGEPLFDGPYIKFLYWIADYYACSILDVLAAAIPADIGTRLKRLVRLSGKENPLLSSTLTSEETLLLRILKPSKDGLSLKTLKSRCGLPLRIFYAAFTRLRQNDLIEIVQETDGAGPKLINQVIWTGREGKSERQKEIIAYLQEHDGHLALSELTKACNTTSNTIKRMEALGMVNIKQSEVVRDPLRSLAESAAGKATPPPELTPDQAYVVGALNETLGRFLTAKTNETDDQPWLLHGVTGSGKTEIYLRLIAECLKQERTALLLVPEISLTPQLAQRLLSRFGDQVAVWHSALSPGERYDTWRRLQSGELKVLLGARSAILAAVPKLALIILDEEHDGSYKQSSPNPRYSAKHLAVERGKREGAMVLLGSATPDTATYHQASSANRILRLAERVHKQRLPESVIVDMRKGFQQGNRGIFSLPLLEELDACLERQEQAILLINRRGYANHIFCRSCGFVIKCHNCSVSLVYHNACSAYPEGRFTCHHCGFTKEASVICPSCQSPFLRHFGLGTQRVEEDIRDIYPQARTLRLDSDITARKGAYEEIFKKFSEGEADILIGTQIVAKGIDIAKVTFVGVLAADAAFNLPDYRSLERGFQLLTQVSGRAGRGHHPGRVVLQTFNDELPALLLARDQDYDSFVKSELESRKNFGYPPFSQLMRIVLSGPEDNAVQAEADALAEELSNRLETFATAEAITLLGPAPCLIERLKGQFRHHILIKNLAGDEGREAVTDFLKSKSSKNGVRITIDIDPLDLI
ncbi:MAG: primosomal protein N' [Candidatus Obscuribacterales bacterium]|nr:primosomal protein N' [Candidatus Obscuribacterales bacterium]